MEAVSLPRTLLGPTSLDFSFSGIKTAVLYLVKGQQGRPPKRIIPPADVAASFQEAVVDTLVVKCRRALELTGRTTLLVGGGVAANQRLREKLAALAEKKQVRLVVAQPEFCTDNAAMVAAAGWYVHRARPGPEPAPEKALAVDADPNSSLITGEDVWTANG